MAKGRNRVVLMLVERLLEDVQALQTELAREAAPKPKRAARRAVNGAEATTEADNG